MVPVGALCVVLYGLLRYAYADLLYITPPGYTASLNGNEVELRCLLHGDADVILWYINGTSFLSVTGEESLRERGIRSGNAHLVEEDRIYRALYIEPRAGNNNTVLQCRSYGGTTASSSEVVFRVQGLLGPPTGLETVYHSSTHEALRWTDPFSLNLTDSPDDITGYSVTVTMESPPPRPPYDPSVSRDQLTATTNQTWRLYLPPLFPFPRYSFPVWLTVRAENPVGLGAPSLPLRYSPPPLDSCLRLGGGLDSANVGVTGEGVVFQTWCQVIAWGVR
jgi:hypothetical protein